MNIEALRDRFNYDENTGVFTRKSNGKVMGYVNSKGYRCIGLGYKIYKAHRMAWAYVHGVEPEEQIDHINGCRDDNRIANLRLATPEDNARNQKRAKNNTSGYKGVSFDKNRKLWYACIYIKRKQLNLGHYDTKEKAASAYALAAYMFHEEFYNLGDYTPIRLDTAIG